MRLYNREAMFDESAAPNFARPMPHWQPLVEYRRNGVAENTIHGAVSWVSGRNVIFSFGGNVEVYGRSMVKPIMMKVFTREFARALTGEQKAISVASHNGDTEHVRVARSMLLQGEWGLMQAPLDVPLVQFGRQVRRPRRWYHCCSGEHAAILRGCKLKGWSRVGYVWPHHPFFQDYLAYIRHALGDEWKQGTIAKDGCGLPTVSMTVTDLETVGSPQPSLRSEEHTSELQSRGHLVCRLLLEKKKNKDKCLRIFRRADSAV